MADITGARLRPKPRPGWFDIVWWALFTAIGGFTLAWACWNHRNAERVANAAAVLAVSVLLLVRAACARAAWRPSQQTAEELIARLYQQKLGARR